MNAKVKSNIKLLTVPQSFFVCLFLLALAVSSASAIDPNYLITQYGHTVWRIQDGYFTTPTAIAQTADGYIWLGTRNGLVRFDGVKFTAWTPPAGQTLPGRSVSALLGTSDGSLWIGTTSGIGRLKDNQITNYSSQPSTGGIGKIIEDESGTVWFTRYRISDGKGSLCQFKDNEFRCFGKDDGFPFSDALGLAKDGMGNIWISSAGIVRWTPESSDVYLAEELKRTGGIGAIDIVADDSGKVWVSLDGVGADLGVRYYSDGKWSSLTVPGFNGAETRAGTLFLDRHNALWVGTETDGLYRIHNGIAEHYEILNGLSGNEVGFIFEDREGNVWITTENGVDMFRDTPVVSFSLSEGLSAVNVYSVLAMKSGSVWVANRTGIDIIQPDGRSSPVRLKNLPGQFAGTMFADRSGRVVIGVDDKLISYQNDQFSSIKSTDGKTLEKIQNIWAMTGDDADNIWVGISKDKQHRLLRIKDQTIQEEIPLDDSVRRPESLAADRQGGIWIGDDRDKIVRYRNGETETITLGEDKSTLIYSLFVDSEDALWAATTKGLYRRQNGILNLLSSENGLPCSTILSARADDSGNFWLYSQCGLLKIPAADIAAWQKFPDSRVSAKVYDALDGALPNPGAVKDRRAAKSADGRIWFTNGKAVQMIDPNRDSANKIPPPVLIEQVVADRQSYQTQERINLPPLSGELEINYTALSYAVPRKVNFRYKLEGHDADWQEVGTRRQAFYNNLSPGNYRFRVIAANNDGVWNETGATLDLTIEPAWYQTKAFYLLCFFLAGIIIWLLYRLRIRQISKIIGARFDERLAERTRLARDLHDTFLQTIQGSKLVADDALEKSDPAQMRRAIERLSIWLGRATDESRAALDSLRTTTTETNDLAEALQRSIESCRLKENNKNLKVEFSVIGKSREMHPIVRDEIYRIATEAISNASQHSEASRIEVELKYARDLQIRVADNGIGIDPLIAESGKPGHFGLRGMRERAALIDGKLTINSVPNSGTEIALVVPGELIFRQPSDAPLEL